MHGRREGSIVLSWFLAPSYCRIVCVCVLCVLSYREYRVAHARTHLFQIVKSHMHRRDFVGCCLRTWWEAQFWIQGFPEKIQKCKYNVNCVYAQCIYYICSENAQRPSPTTDWIAILNQDHECATREQARSTVCVFSVVLHIALERLSNMNIEPAYV